MMFGLSETCFRYIVTLVLVITFCIQVNKSLQNWLDDKVGINIDTEENEMTDFPAVTLFSWGRSVTGVNETLEQLNNDIPISQFITNIHWKCDEGDFDFCEKNIIQNISMHPEIRGGIKGYPGPELGINSLSKYVTYTPKHLVYPDIRNRLEIHVNMSHVNMPMLFVVFHDPDYIIPNPSHAGGSRVLLIMNYEFYRDEFYRCSYMFEVSRKRIEKFNHSKKKCVESNDSKFSQCIQSYISTQLGCRLPWIDNETDWSSWPRICNKNSDLEPFLQLSQQLFQMSSLKTQEKTNCTQNCHYTEYEASKKFGHCSENINEDRNEVHILFFLTGGEIKVEKFVPSYTGNNFIADVGGYLGLLLGVSLYSVYDVLILMIKKKTTKKMKLTKNGIFSRNSASSVKRV